jgi:DNA polymerase-3 subunit delta
MTPKQLLSDISSGKFRPVYYFFGSEDYRIVEAEKFIAATFLPEEQQTSNFRRLDARETKGPDLVAELSVYPMLGERQVFAVSDFQRYRPAEVERVLKILAPPDPNRVVIFSSPSERTPKKNSAFFRAMAKAGETVEFKRLTAIETAGTISRKLTRAGLTIEPEALKIMTELVAGNRGALEAETDKLLDYKEEGEKVTVDDVGRVCSGYQVYSIFDLADHVVQGDMRRALDLIRSLLSDGNSPTSLVYHLGTHFLSLYKVKNSHPLESTRRFLLAKFRDQAAGFENEQLEAAIETIAEADAAMRQTGAKPSLLLEALIVRLVSRPDV